MDEGKQKHLNKVQITASLPCYLKDNVDKQRGKGVFEKSILGLKQLNSYGYGMKDKDLILNLVYNPSGPQLPPSQKELEDIYRRELKWIFIFKNRRSPKP